MIRLSAVIVLAIGVTACSPTQQAALQAPVIYQTVTDPNLTVEQKACAVLNWGIPVAQERAATLTLTLKQQSLVNGAIQTASAYCGGGNRAWQERAVAAADVLSKVLWDVIK